MTTMCVVGIVAVFSVLSTAAAAATATTTSTTARVSPLAFPRLINSSIAQTAEIQYQAVQKAKVSSSAVGKVVGGVEADHGAYPFFVRLRSLLGSTKCGGSLVAPDVVLTAAHCDGDSGNFDVSVNGYTAAFLNNQDEVTTVSVEKLLHPDFALDTFSHDYMLLKLRDPIESIEPVKLNFDGAIPGLVEDLRIIGLGNIQEGGQFPFFLQEVIVQHTDVEFCRNAYANVGLDLVQEEVMFCAQGDDKDACQGDSGGPIMDMNNIQLGVVSFGLGCARPEFPGVYSRVSAVQQWLTESIRALSAFSFDNAENTGAPIVPVTEGPAVPETAAPVVPVTEAPIVPATAAPVVPVTEAPVVPVTEAPVVLDTAAPVVPVTEAPVVSETPAPVVPVTKAPVVPETAAPVVPATEAPLVLVTANPVVPVTEAPVIPDADAPVVPVTEAPVVPVTEAPVVPATEAPVVPITVAPSVPETAAPVVPVTEAPVVPATEAPAVPITEAPGVPETAAPVVPVTEAPFVPDTDTPTTESPVTTAPAAAEDTPSPSAAPVPSLCPTFAALEMPSEAPSTFPSVDTKFPSFAPFEVPTQSRFPTFFPFELPSSAPSIPVRDQKAGPAPTPGAPVTGTTQDTPSGTLAPSYAGGARGPGICDDFSDKTFSMDNGRAPRSCSWLQGQSTADIEAICTTIGSEAYEVCEETCGKCIEACEDDINAVFLVFIQDDPKPEIRGCKWVNDRPRIRTMVCVDGHDAYYVCPETCNSCAGEDMVSVKAPADYFLDALDARDRSIGDPRYGGANIQDSLVARMRGRNREENNDDEISDAGGIQ